MKLRRRSIRQVVTRQMNVNPSASTERHTQPGHIRLLSFNIQVGNTTSAYHHYVTNSWQHVLPYAGREVKLRRIGELLADYDLVALQEVDGGSLRSGYANQVEYLAKIGSFPYWYQQLNRNFGPFAKHSNGVLTRVQPSLLEDHPLPGLQGRGAILLKYGEGDNSLMVVMMHLALGVGARNLQLEYIRKLVKGYRHQILMGDLNTQAVDLLQHSPLKDLGLLAPQVKATFPSWRPQRCLDHILVSPGLSIAKVDVLPIAISDHLPVSMELVMPKAVAAHSQLPIG